MTAMQNRTRESSINYSSTRKDGGNKGMEGKQRVTYRR